MTVATGTQNSANAAGAFLGNGTGTGTIDTQLLGNGWTFIEEITAVQANTTGPVQIWEMATAPKSYVHIEYDNVNARFRFFASELYDAGANQAQYAVRGGAGGGAAETPTAEGYASNAAAAIGTAGTYVSFAFENSTAITWVLYTTGTVIALSCYTAAAATRGIIVGYYTPFTEADVCAWSNAKPLFLTRLHATAGQLWADTSGFGGTRIARLAWGAVSHPGGFGAIWDFPIPTRLTTTANIDTAWAGRINGGTALKGFTNPICFPPVLWGSYTTVNDGGIVGGDCGPMGYLPDFVVVNVSTLVVGGNQDTLNVDGTTYYVMGHVKPGTNTGMAIAVHS